MVRANSYTATIDACVLAGALSRNLILSLAAEGMFRPHWSIETLAETERAIRKIREGKGDANAGATAVRQRGAIQRAFPESVVEGHGILIPALTLPDPDDRHVLAAAIVTLSTVIVTDNLKDYPVSQLAPFDIKPSNTDEFLADVIDLDLPRATTAIRSMRERLKNPTITAEVLLTRMDGIGLNQTVNLLLPAIVAL